MSHAATQLHVTVTPMGKPRMTQRDKWAQRPCVMRWRSYADALRAEAKKQSFTLPESGAVFHFVIPMPASWSKSKREALRGKPCKAKPDLDNISKGLMDALLPKDDAKVWHLAEQLKIWGDEGSVTIYARAA